MCNANPSRWSSYSTRISGKVLAKEICSRPYAGAGSTCVHDALRACSRLASHAYISFLYYHLPCCFAYFLVFFSKIRRSACPIFVLSFLLCSIKRDASIFFWSKHVSRLGNFGYLNVFFARILELTELILTKLINENMVGKRKFEKFLLWFVERPVSSFWGESTFSRHPWIPCANVLRIIHDTNTPRPCDNCM